MKKIFKSKKISNIIFGTIGIILGVVIGGIVGVTATTNKLEAKYVMYTKDGETMTVQDAIKDLYVLSKNNEGGSSQTLPLGTIIAEGYKITIPYTGSYQNIKCVYGIDENYGSVGTINGNTCTFTGTDSNQKLYYKIVATNITSDTEGVVYKNSGSVVTGASGVTIVKTGLPTGIKAIVYLDPTNLGAICNASNSTVGSGTSGCMKWYAFSEDSKSYTMILDHNTKSNVAWNSDNVNTSMKEVQTELNNIASGWKVTPRLIKAQEIANITGNTRFNSATSTYKQWFYLDSNTTTQTAKSAGASKYYWLFDYTGGSDSTCTSFGCKVADSNVNNLGYWTDTSTATGGGVWTVYYEGSLTSYGGKLTAFGVRPVITVQKSDL